MLFSTKNNLLVLLLLISSVVFSQTLPCKNSTINDGLPSNSIKCIFKDSRGLLWIGTENGLCSYNGKDYKIYNETNGLKYNNVWSITEDNQHNLWFSLYSEGIAKFDGKKFLYYNTNNGLIHNSVRKIHFSKKYNCLILGTENGLSIFDGKKFKSFKEKTLIDKFQIMGINEDKNRILISVNYNKVFALKIAKDISKSGLIEEFEPIPSFSSFLYKDNYFSGGSDSFLYQRNLNNNKVTIKPCNKIWDFTSDSNNTVYCAAWNVTDPDGGLYKISNNSLENITKKANITSTSLWCLYFDKKSNQLWVGSTDKGIFVVDLSHKITALVHNYFGLKKLEVQSLFITKDNTTWIGASDNIIILKKDFSFKIFDKKSIWNEIEKYIKNKKLSKDQQYKYHEFIPRNGFTCLNITSDNQGYVLVNTTQGTFCFDSEYKLIYYNFGQSNGGNIVFGNKDQAIYTAMYNNTFVHQNKFNWDLNAPLPKTNINTPLDILKIAKDKKNIWFGSYSKGLFRYTNGQFSSMNQNGQFQEKNIRDLLVDRKGNLIIGTNLGNVYIFKPENKKLVPLAKYRSNIEIIGNTITFIEEVNGYYFIGTNKGINVIKDNQLLKLFNKSEGLADLQINDSFQDINGNLVLATNNGLIKINTTKVINDLPSFRNKIEINDIKVNGENSIYKNDFIFGVFNSTDIKLDYLQNDIEIYFSTNNLFNADKDVYRYKIEGLNDNWSEFESIDKINLRGLPNGKFRVIIEGKNLGTGEVYKSKSIAIEIIPPFWKTTVFFVVVILVIVALSLFVVKKRISQIKREADIQNTFNKRLAETKMEALQSQMNPHFIFNAMNSIQNFIIDNKTDDALKYMAMFSKLIRQTLNNSSKPLVKLVDEIQYLETYINIERMRFPYGIEFNLEVDKSVDINKIEIPPMLIQPFIENVFVHAFDSDSKGSKLNVQFSLANGELHCRVEDNGNGIDKSKLNQIHESRGIKLVQERMDLFQNNKESILISSELNKGTIVVLILKIS